MARNSKNKKVNQCTYFVDGMHCPSCEILIEKELLKNENIEAVDASLQNKTVRVSYLGKNKPELDGLNDAMPTGYSISTHKIKTNTKPLFSFDSKGALQLNKQKFWDISKVVLLLGLLTFGYLLYNRSGLESFVAANSTATSVPAYFLVGLAAGVSTCAALLGGLILSMSKQWNENYLHEHNQIKKLQPHLFFHAGRLVSFTLVGLLLGLIGSFVVGSESEASAVPTTVSGLASVLVAIVLLVLGLQMLNVPFLKKLQIRAPKRLVNATADENNFKTYSGPFALGAFTFLIPCPITLTAFLAAFSSGNVLTGGLILLFFALGTFITLALISFGGSNLVSSPRFSNAANTAIAMLVLFISFASINSALIVFGAPNLQTIFASGEVDDPIEVNATDGVQVMNITAEGFEYIPTGSTTLKAGVPAVLEVDNKGVQGCANFMAANGLIDNFVSLKQGINTIDLGTPKKGTYYLSCSMGMVRPVIINVI